MGAVVKSELISYILHFLIGDDANDVARLVGYTSDRDSYAGYKVVVCPSGFFDDENYATDRANPAPPFPTLEGVPILFGEPRVEREGETIIVYADIVASAYYLISRYEEMLRRDIRDEHGRFPGRCSLPVRGGFIDRPIVDEYGCLLRKWLVANGVALAKQTSGIRQIYLTHDVDAPFGGQTWRNVARRICSGGNPFKALRDKFASLERDPYYTFPWLLQQDQSLQHALGEKCRPILFFKAGGANAIREDRPLYDLRSRELRQLIALCREYGAEIGLHASYSAGQSPSLIADEKANLENACKQAITKNRHHYLASREPEDMEYLARAGITDDYTLGYADTAGFRLGTARPVRYINPVTRRVSSSLTLHHLTVMDCTLDAPHYMNVSADEAESYCLRLINNARKANGDLALLWHNTTVIEGKGYQRGLYAGLLKYLAEYV